MSKRLGRALVGVLTVVTIGAAGLGCRQASERELELSKIGIQEEHKIVQVATMGRNPFPGGERMLRIWQNKQDLTIQFEDAFKQELGLDRWSSLPVAPVDGGGYGKVTAGNGYAQIEAFIPTPAGPGVMASNLFGPKKKHFNPGLKDGAYVTIGGSGSYRRNRWKVQDVKIFVSE